MARGGAVVARAGPSAAGAAVPQQQDDTEQQVKDRFCQFLLEFRRARRRRSISQQHSSNKGDKDVRMVYVEQLQNMAENEKTTILVDFGDVEHFDAELAVAIETEYYRFEWSLRAGARAAYDDVVKEDEDDGVDGGSRNFVIFVAFTNLKRAPRKLREMNSSRIGTLSLMKGTVTRTSDVRPELLYGSFTCLKCGMQRTDVEQQLRYTTPTVCLNTSCNNQSSSAWDLDVEGSTFSDWQRIRVQESPDEIPAGSLPRSFDIIVRDAMVERVKAGDKIVATGSLCVMPDASGLARAGESAVAQRTTATPAGDLSQGVTGTKLLGSRELTYKLIFVACSIESVERNRFGKSAPVGKNETTTTQIDDNELLDEDSDEDEEERRIVEEMRTTPQLYDKLAASMAPTIYGHADIKHGVLLQLVGGLHKQTPEGIKLRGDVNVCVVGDPSTAKSQFLKYVHGFSPRAVYTSGKAASAAGLTASIVRDSDTGEFCVEAGALMLADNGICCFPAEDHQLLTNRGFLLLEDVLEHSHSSCEPLKFATFDRSTKQFRYESAQRIVVNEGMQSLVEFTPDDEAAFRATNVHKEPSPCDRPSSDECRRHSASKNIGQTTTNRLSIVATGNHDMYVATGSVGFNGEPRFGDDATFLKVKAHSIADDFDKYSAVRFMAHAEGGLGVSATPSADALRELFEFLVLDTKKKQVAFLECYGFMLSISGRPASFGVDLGSCAIIFRQLDRDGSNFLRIRVTTCELDGSRWEETPDKSFGSIETFRFIIRDRRWISTFIGVSDVEARSLAERVARAHGISHNDGAQVDSPSKSPRVVSHISQTPQRRRDEARTGCVTPDFSSRSSRARTSKRSVRETEGDEHVRRLPRWVKALPKDLARALIRGFRSTEYDDDEASLRTSSASLRDDLLIICLHAGYAANFQSVPRRSFDGEGDAATSEWEITCSSKESHTFPTLRNNSTEISHLRQRLCKTWCISVPSSFVVVRRVIKNGDGIVAYASTPTIQGNCIDEFDKMDSADQVAIHEAMEQQTISITKAGIQANLNARTSILAAANPKHGRYDRTKTLKANVDMTAPIMSRFDLFFVVVDDCDEMVDRSVAAHIVDSHRGLRRALEAPFTLHQLQTYVRAARRQQPSISDAARRRLVSCYRALRQNDVVGRGKTAYRITVRQLESMVRLAEAHARLHFQTQVQVANVVEAFRLLKKSIISVETEGVMLEEEDEEEEAYLEDEAADQDQEEAKNDEEEVATRPAKVARVEDVPARPPAVAVAATPPEVKGEEAGRPDGETPPMPKVAAAAKKKKREKIRLSYEDFKRYEHDLTTRLRKRDGGIKRTELIALYLQAHYDSIGDDVDKIAEHTRLIKQIIKRLLKDEAIIVVPSEEDDESAADEVILAIHPNYTPLDDAM